MASSYRQRGVFLLATKTLHAKFNVLVLGSTAEDLVPPANTRANLIILSFGVARCIKLGLFQDGGNQSGA